MKKSIIIILKIFFVLLFIELIVGLISTSFGGVVNDTIFGKLAQIFNYLMNLLSYPIVLIDKSYPYYAMMSLSKVLGLISLNTLLQSIIIWLLFYRKRIKV